jgi:hypothetical protein
MSLAGGTQRIKDGTVGAGRLGGGSLSNSRNAFVLCQASPPLKPFRSDCVVSILLVPDRQFRQMHIHLISSVQPLYSHANITTQYPGIAGSRNRSAPSSVHRFRPSRPSTSSYLYRNCSFTRSLYNQNSFKPAGYGIILYVDE